MPISVICTGDLHRRLDDARWPAQLTHTSWESGVPTGYLQQLASYWRHRFDWRAQEARINALPQFTTDIDGQRVHFIHARSAEPDAMPLLITHGWPGSVVELLDIIEPLRNPRAFGGDPRDAFHVIAPSLPGFGFSTPLSSNGWNLARIARAWSELMQRLGGWPQPPTVPVGAAVFSGDNTIRAFAERGGPGHFSEFDVGGHFASMECPQLLVSDIRKFIRSLRT